MNNTSAIFIFTRDRPETLYKTLKSIKDVPYAKYIIDDSVATENQQCVLALSNSYSKCNYLGKVEFNQFTNHHQIYFPKFDFLLREVGFKEWNLGYARNFALLFSKSLRIEKVLFTDDDIEVPNLKLIEKLFQSINNYQFVGANILGLVDDSVLGHIATDIGIMNERMLSGGFLAFNPNTIDHYFLNNYNEDWIWLFLQLKEKIYLQTGEVFQEFTDSLTNYKGKVMFQEFGEIALDGILNLYSEGSYDSLMQLQFWDRIINERKEYLDILITKSREENNKKYVEAIEWVKSNSKEFTADVFMGLFQQYFNNLTLFRSLCHDI